MNRRALYVAVASVALGFSAWADGEDAAQTAPPATAPSTAPSVTSSRAPQAGTAAAATIDAAAQTQIDAVAKAYSALKGFEASGTFTGDVVVGDKKQGGVIQFTSSFAAPNRFVHVSKVDQKEDMRFGSTGKLVYVYVKAENGYVQAPAPDDRVAIKDLPAPLPRVLALRNPSLTLAVAKDPAAEIASDAKSVSRVEDSKIDGQDFPTLRIEQNDGAVLVMAFDKQTNLLRRVDDDIKKVLENDGVADVKKASYRIDFEKTAAASADAPEAQFAWAIPDGAKDMKAARGDEGANPAEGLVGKDAPAFTLSDLSGAKVALADLKGSVVVLDLWATWCPPCRASLPHLGEFYQSYKDKGVKVFAVNQSEEKEKVAAFVEKTKLSVPVLLDSDGKMGSDYQANAIPETVVVGKDGKVAKVFIGFNPGSTPAELRATVDDAMKK